MEGIFQILISPGLYSADLKQCKSIPSILKSDLSPFLQYKPSEHKYDPYFFSACLQTGRDPRVTGSSLPLETRVFMKEFSLLFWMYGS